MEKNGLNTVISRNMIVVRNQRRYSQHEIAAVLQIKQPSYNRMESGKTRVSADQLAVLAAFYKLPIDFFFSDRLGSPSVLAIDRRPARVALRNRRLGAFSLTEVLVVLVIIGIITLLALPNLMPLITKAKSTGAKGQLQHAYTQQKTHFDERSTYSDGGQANYRLEVVQAGASDFVIRATALSMSGRSIRIRI